MESPEPFHFTPAPCRRRDGWTAERQERFILLVAEGYSAGDAAAEVGLSRQTAYALRSRPDAADFACAWDHAAAHARSTAPARKARFRTERTAGDRLRIPRTYRGRLIGTIERDDLRGAMARLRSLDRMLDRPRKLTK
uniref:helix-turn-helix domain-containing protein n=1 Tax=uncultured Sphingomonas sp. TaxID=158754 RepID=UPI0025DE5669|nr:helix-turn-helix domain-containing protein [uncultured Sphingomonas sp.]